MWLSFRKKTGRDFQWATCDPISSHLLKISWIKLVQLQSKEQNRSVELDASSAVHRRHELNMKRLPCDLWGFYIFVAEVWSVHTPVPALCNSSLWLGCVINIHKIANGIKNAEIPQFITQWTRSGGTWWFCPTWTEGCLNSFALSKWRPLLSNGWILQSSDKETRNTRRSCAHRWLQDFERKCINSLGGLWENKQK